MKPTRVSCSACCQSRSATDESRAARGSALRPESLQSHKTIGTVKSCKQGGEALHVLCAAKGRVSGAAHHSRQSCFFTPSTRLQIDNGVSRMCRSAFYCASLLSVPGIRSDALVSTHL